MLELLFTSARLLTFAGGTPSFLGYLQSGDACILANYTSLDKIFRDGTQLNLGKAITAWPLGSRQGGRHFWMAAQDANPISCYGADEITGQPLYQEILNPAWPIPLGLYRTGDYVDDRAGLFYHNATAGAIQIYRLADGQLLQTFNLPGVSGYGDFLAPAGGARLLAAQKSTGKVALLDYRQGTVLWQSQVRPFCCATYDLRHDLIITLETDEKIRLYLLTPVPAVLSTPAWSPPVAQVHRLHGYPVQVRLTGDAGEPCPGYWIEWSLAGSPAKGSLLRPSTRTDAEGYAGNFYFGPAGAGDTGLETIQAQVIV